MIIDINMHALPEYLFQDEATLESYLRIAPQAYGQHAKLTAIPGSDKEVERFDPAVAKFREYFGKNLYFDISTPTAWSKAQLECAVKEFAADHILYGSSYPVRLDWVLNGVDYVRSLDITEEERGLIFCRNAERLFRIE